MSSLNSNLFALGKARREGVPRLVLPRAFVLLDGIIDRDRKKKELVFSTGVQQPGVVKKGVLAEKERKGTDSPTARKSKITPTRSSRIPFREG